MTTTNPTSPSTPHPDRPRPDRAPALRLAVRGEPDPRPCPEDRGHPGAVADIFDALVATWRYRPDARPRGPALVDGQYVPPRAVRTAERKLDDNEQAQKRRSASRTAPR